MCWDVIVIELKAVSELNEKHDSQLFKYMRIAKPPVRDVKLWKKGELQWKRFILDLKLRKTGPSNPRQVRPMYFKSMSISED